MIRFYPKSIYVLLVVLAIIACKEESKQKITKEEKEIVVLPPEELYSDLFYDIQQNENLFNDSKTFVDAIPEKSLDSIKSEYEKIKDNGEIGRAHV